MTFNPTPLRDTYTITTLNPNYYPQPGIPVRLPNEIQAMVFQTPAVVLDFTHTENGVTPSTLVAFDQNGGIVAFEYDRANATLQVRPENESLPSLLGYAIIDAPLYALHLQDLHNDHIRVSR